MALKAKLTNDEYTKLNPALKTEYKQDGEEYVLEVEGAEDVSKLKTAHERAKEDAKKAKQEAYEAKQKLKEKEDADAEAERQREEAAARKKGDFTAIEEGYKAKIAKQEAEAKAREEALQADLRGILVDKEATLLASELSPSPSVLLPHIQKRLTVETVDGKSVTRVLDATGKPSVMTVAELKQEFLANKDFAGVVKGSNASGGGASGARPSAGGGGGGKVDLSKSPRDIVAAMKAGGKVVERPI